MSYQDVVELHDSPALRLRVVACAAIEGIEHPEMWVADRAWDLAAQAGWSEAWATAKEVTTDPSDLGASDVAISDSMILAAVQSLRAVNEPTPEL